MKTAVTGAVGSVHDGARRGAERRRELRCPEVVQQAGEVARPADRDRRGAERVLEHQVPADDPGDELAERRVAVGVGGAGDRNRRGELRIAQAGERAGRRRRGPSTARWRGPACAAAACPVRTKMPVPMMAPMPERDQIDGPKHALEACSPVVGRFALSAARCDFVANIDRMHPPLAATHGLEAGIIHAAAITATAAARRRPRVRASGSPVAKQIANNGDDSSLRLQITAAARSSVIPPIATTGRRRVHCVSGAARTAPARSRRRRSRCLSCGCRTRARRRGS